MGRNIVKLTVLEQVYEAIKDDITSGYYQPGEKLIIRNLKERYKVSDTPIKQSLNRLVSEGLVISKERRGLWVKEFEEGEIQDLFRVRYMLESYCIKNLCKDKSILEDTLFKLEDNVQKHRDHLDSVKNKMSVSEYRVHMNIDMAFHLIIVGAIQSNYIEKMYREIQSHAYMSLVYEKRGNRAYELTYSEHVKILNYLKEGDYKGATNAIKSHLKSFCNDMGIPFCE